jgi:hypothetical protein
MNVHSSLDFEQYQRITPPQSVSDKPEMLYDLSVFATHTAIGLSRHYSDKNVGAVCPVYGSTDDMLVPEPVLKIVSAGSFKPEREEHSDTQYLRVCAEQNLIDNGLYEGDHLLGVIFLRFRKQPEKLEGNPYDGGFLCKPCRKRAARVIGPNIVVVSFVGESNDPVSAMTIGQMNDIQDYHQAVEPLAEGSSIRPFIIERVLSSIDYRFILRNKPLLPSRMYRRDDEQQLPFTAE